jgi:hydroxymethylbilane synthase
MSVLRIGTRGSPLALRQTEVVCDALRRAHPSLRLEVVTIKTAADLHPEAAIGEGWPVGGFTSALEETLAAGTIDVAVHSHKDLPTRAAPGLIVAAVPTRGPASDVLVTERPVGLSEVPAGFRIGTSSPRRAAQLRRFVPGAVVVPIRGNVTTRLEKVGGAVDGVVLALAGLVRLGTAPPHALELPQERFVPAPGQGALAVQAREGEPTLRDLLRAIHDEAAARQVAAERAFLARLGPGCRTAAAALARGERGSLVLHGQLFGAEGRAMVEGRERGGDPLIMGTALADRLRRELGEAP